MVTYLTGVITLALFHFHAPHSSFGHDSEMAFNTPTESQFSGMYHSTDDCTVCNSNSQYIHINPKHVDFQEVSANRLFITHKLVIKRLVVDSLLRRGPPLTV